jgi:hypothetical protein
MNSYEYLAQETGYIEQPALHPDQSTNDLEIHKMKGGLLDRLIYGDDGLISKHSVKIIGAMIGTGYAFYTKKPNLWPYALIGALVGWVTQLKGANSSF